MRSSTTVLLLVAVAASSRLAAAAEPTPGKQVEQTVDLGDGQSISLLLYLPAEYPGDKKWPLMLFLHGRGESFGPLSLVKKWGPPRLIEQGETFPYIVASPQCPGDSSWSSEDQQAKLVKLIEHLQKTYQTDASRLYLTGLSMGGYGSWRLAADHPELFAAVAPICGKGDPADADKLKELPIWAFHGTEDRAVPFAGSADMVDAIRAAGGTEIRFTSLEEIGHNSWSAAYATPELYGWFDSHSR